MMGWTCQTAAAVAALLAVALCGGPAVAAPPADPAPAGEAGYVNFQFDQVDVQTFVKLVGGMTGRKFVVAEGLDRKVTVVSPRVSKDEVYPLFLSILESLGYSVVQEGGIHRVIALPEGGTRLGPLVGDAATADGGVVTRVLRLEHVSAFEVKRMFDALVEKGKASNIGAIEETNHLVISDTRSAVRSIEEIVAQIDRPGSARTSEVLRLQHADAVELAGQLNEAVSESERRADALRRRLPGVGGDRQVTAGAPVVVASKHANSLILAGTQSQLTSLRKLIVQMDVAPPADRGRLHAIFLKYILAEDAAKSLNALLQAAKTDKEEVAASRRIAIEALPGNNALLVDAAPVDFEVVRGLIETVDQVPQQVHIAVLIAEVSANEEFRLGVEMAAMDMPAVGETTLQGGSRLKEGAADTLMSSIQSGVFPQGLTVGLASGLRVAENGSTAVGFPAAINVDALKKIGNFKVLSETALEAQNNREASVNIVNEIPILKSTIQGGSGTSRDVIQNIERVDVGIKLKLTPHVIPGGDVQMTLNPSIEAVIDPGPSGTQFAPTIAKREVSTTVTVGDGRTIVIAGLTRHDRTRVTKRVPILGSIPLLGWLFRHDVESSEDTNLLIFVTPRVVAGLEAAERVKLDWQDKTGIDPAARK